jgi:hypothetical protein
MAEIGEPDRVIRREREIDPLPGPKKPEEAPILEPASAI